MGLLAVRLDRDDATQGVDGRRRFTIRPVQRRQPVEQREVLLVQGDAALGRPILIEVVG